MRGILANNRHNFGNKIELISPFAFIISTSFSWIFVIQLDTIWSNSQQPNNLLAKESILLFPDRGILWLKNGFPKRFS